MILNTASSTIRQGRREEKRITIEAEFIDHRVPFDAKNPTWAHATFKGAHARFVLKLIERGPLGCHKAECQIGIVLDLKRAGFPLMNAWGVSPFSKGGLDGFKVHPPTVRVSSVVEDVGNERVIVEAAHAN